MKSAHVTRDSFSILNDYGDMVAGVMVFHRKTVDVSPAGAYRGFDPLPAETPELRAFAEAEARRLGIVDD